MRKTHWVLISTLIVAAAVAGGAVYMLVLRPMPVAVAEERMNVAVELFGLGTIEARVVSKVGLKVSGVLMELAADQGDMVPKGALLARLDTREQEARVARVFANMGQARASLIRAEASVERARALLSNAQRIEERRRTLVAKGDVSVEAAETAQASMATASADLSVARADVEVARAALKDAEAQHRLESVALDLHTLTAPYDARIVARHRELGTVLQSGEPVFTLVDAGTVWALVYIDESRATHLATGQPAEVVLRSQPNVRISGRVVRIDIEADRVNEERKVYIAFDSPRQDFHLGEQIEAHITVTMLDRALLVPDAAIRDQRGTAGKVWTIEDGRLTPREIVLGQRILTGEREIVGGVPSGAQVVVSRLPASTRAGRAVSAVPDKPR